MSDRILAAVMPGPRQPIEIREFTGRICPPAAPCCGRRAPRSAVPTCTSGTDGLPAFRIRSFPATSRPESLDAMRGAHRQASTGPDCAKATARSSSTCIARADAAAPAPSIARRRDAVARASTASPTPADEGLFGGWSQAIYLEPGVAIARLPDARRARRLHRRRLRPADRRAHRRARDDSVSATACSSREPARSGSAPSRSRGWVAPRRSSRSARLPRGSTLARGWVPTASFDLDATTRPSVSRESVRLTHGEGRRRRDRGRRIGARDRRGARPRARRRTLRDRRPLHGRRAELGQRAPADQPQAPGDPRLLGQRAAALPARAVVSRAITPRTCRGARSASGPTAARQLNEALADAEAMRITKALVDPCRRDHASHEDHRDLGPVSSAPERIDALIVGGRRRLPPELLARHARDPPRRLSAHSRGCQRAAGRHVAIMQDLSGPKIRTGPLAGGVPIDAPGRRELRIAAGDGAGDPAASSRPTPS